MTEVSVIPATTSEKAPVNTAVESEETNTYLEQPDTAVTVHESVEKSEEQVNFHVWIRCYSRA